MATTARRLEAAHVIHTVGPVWSPTEGRSALLAPYYCESLRVAAGLGARTVAFPAISTGGVYRRPLDDAARIAVGAVRGALAAGQDGVGSAGVSSGGSGSAVAGSAVAGSGGSGLGGWGSGRVGSGEVDAGEAGPGGAGPVRRVR